MKRTWRTVIFGTLVVLLVGCGAPDVQPGQVEEATPTVPEATVAALAPTSAPSPSAQEPAATTTPPAIAEEPAPTSTPLPATEEPTSTSTPLLPATEEPTSTSTPPSTATLTVPPPTLTPSAVPLSVFSVEDVQRMMPAEAKALVDSGGAVLYDVRSEAEYNAQHADGAISLPGASLAARYSDLPSDKSLVFY